jgi:hypothetical protein
MCNTYVASDEGRSTGEEGAPQAESPRTNPKRHILVSLQKAEKVFISIDPADL